MREIIETLRCGDMDARDLERLLRRRSKNAPGGTRRYSKKKLMPYFLEVEREHPEQFASWALDDETRGKLLQLIRVKPRRTASGVATITVITKPWTCRGTCLFCPNDLSMPKSYLADEPACQRAQRHFFDPFLQVRARLHTLNQMGHITDKVELIVLGGTWNDYPEDYRIWFVAELFRALNTYTGVGEDADVIARREHYGKAGLSDEAAVNKKRLAAAQARVDAGESTYNTAWTECYGENDVWAGLADGQRATLSQLEPLQRENESAAHRVVGLVVETRPDTVDAGNLTLLRRMGCTKVQMGVQTLDEQVAVANRRALMPEAIAHAFALVRLFGFKIHAHFMVNLYGSNPRQDEADYRRFVTDPLFLPDEVKLYPCVLVAGTGLVACRNAGTWSPYDEETLVRVLCADTLATPPYCRISRMIRDISAHDIVAGNRKINLRQAVEERLREEGASVREIRFREPGTSTVERDALSLEDIVYETDVSEEHFLQWVTPEGTIAGFLRLSLPKADALARFDGLPVSVGEAMIREVHVYGAVAELHRTGSGSQHLGLGRLLVQRACEIAHSGGFESIDVISSVGTRGYYRKLGFVDGELYQRKLL